MVNLHFFRIKLTKDRYEKITIFKNRSLLSEIIYLLVIFMMIDYINLTNYTVSQMVMNASRLSNRMDTVRAKTG